MHACRHFYAVLYIPLIASQSIVLCKVLSRKPRQVTQKVKLIIIRISTIMQSGSQSSTIVLYIDYKYVYTYTGYAAINTLNITLCTWTD